MRGGDGECRGELVAHAQRGALSVAERSALRAHLASCDSCRLIQQVASDFAEMSAVDRSDDSRLERMSALARRAAGGGGRLGRRRAPPTRMRALAAAACLVLVAGTASATVWLLPLLTRTAPQPPSATAPPFMPAASRPAARRTPAQDAVTLSPPVIPAPAPIAVAPGRPQPLSIRPRTRAPASAAALLREARAAATAGRGAEAVTLYRRLQREFSASSEALVATVPLGRLLLERASPQGALDEFNRYLGGARGGALVPEALYGRAQALARIGDRDLELAAWRRLVSDFPDSPYSAVARRRLSERQ